MESRLYVVYFALAVFGTVKTQPGGRISGRVHGTLQGNPTRVYT